MTEQVDLFSIEGEAGTRESGTDRCPHCGQKIAQRKISLYRGMVASLSKVYKWCVQHNTYTFTRKQVKHLFHNENETARFGDWVMFGGLFYKPEGRRGVWGMNMERTERFLRGDYQIPMTIWKDPITGVLTKEDYGSIDDIPSITKFLDDEGFYIAEYRK